MDFSQFYESIILRDLFEYITPGLVFLSSISLTIEAFARKSGSSGFLSNFFEKGGAFAYFLVVVLAFPAGQFLTGISSAVFRSKEKQRTVRIVNENDWLKKRIVRVASHYLKAPDSEITILLEEPKSANFIRETGRDILQIKGSPLHREHLARLSILSRLCQNTAVALAFLLLSMSLSSILLWDELRVLSSSLHSLPLIGITILALIIAAIRVFQTRAVDLRRRMVILTFQAWYIDYLEPSKRLDTKAAQRVGKRPHSRPDL